MLKDISAEDVRLFCLGKELKDDLFMYSYDIADEVVMQLMIRKTQWVWYAQASALTSIKNSQQTTKRKIVVHK